MCGIFLYYGNNVDIELLKKNGMLIKHRGPDNTTELFYNIANNKNKENILYIVFHRLAINDVHKVANQPFEDEDIIMVCNGEIYNHYELEREYNIITKSRSDCEVILHLYKSIGIEKTISLLDGVYSFILYDKKLDKLFVARDYIGVRPMFYGNTNSTSKNGIVFCSELKGINDLCTPSTIQQFTPNTLSIFTTSNDTNIIIEENKLVKCNFDNTFVNNINKCLTKSIYKRLHRIDRPIGFLLSGGLDSSLVVSIANELKRYVNRPLELFTIGNDEKNDLKYARLVAKHIGGNLNVVPFDFKKAINYIPGIIESIESYDVTTVRASTPMWLLCKYIRENTDIKVIFSGEGADEIAGGYLYHKSAPNNTEWEMESNRLMKELHYFDVLRADKCVSAHGLELRVPFLDKSFLNAYKSLDTELKNTKVEKKYLRDQFNCNIDFNGSESKSYLPKEVLYRQKEALSDGIGHNWVNYIKEAVEDFITDEELENANEKYKFNTPKTKEAYWYREIYDAIYPDKDHLIPHYWLPKWQGDINDPSATILNNYK